MLNPKQRRMSHKLVIHDMAVQSLQRDFAVIENLKMSKVYMPILEQLLKSITNDYYNLKRVLAKDKIKIVKWEKVSEYFSDLTITTAGNDDLIAYLIISSFSDEIR